jgi:ATP-dependent helicase HrpA
VLEDATDAALDALVAEAGGPAWDEAAWERLRDHVAGGLAERTLQVVRHVVAILDAAAGRPAAPGGAHRTGVRGRPRGRRRAARAPGPRALAAGVGARRLPDVLRYVQGAARRLERLPDNAAVDRDRMRAIHELEAERRRRLAELPPGAPASRAPSPRSPGCSRSCA